MGCGSGLWAHGEPDQRLTKQLHTLTLALALTLSPSPTLP